jgi:hypothetical protein
LNPLWTKLTTLETSPVTKGTVLTVSCEEGFFLQGSSTVTCIGGYAFSSDNFPSCVKLGKKRHTNQLYICFLWLSIY